MLRPGAFLGGRESTARIAARIGSRRIDWSINPFRLRPFTPIQQGAGLSFRVPPDIHMQVRKY